MFELGDILVLRKKVRKSWVRIGRRIKETLEQDGKKFPVVCSQNRPSLFQQPLGVGRQEKRLQKEIPDKSAAGRFVLRGFEVLAPAISAIIALLKKPLRVQAHGTRPTWPEIFFPACSGREPVAIKQDVVSRPV